MPRDSQSDNPLERHLEQQLLERYGGVGVRMRFGHLRFHLRRLTFLGVLRGTHLVKRLLDLVIALPLALVMLPGFLLLAALIRIESPGPVFFAQQRIGRHGKPFTMFKFRSMFLDAEARKQELAKQNESGDGVIFKMKHDPRITRVGRFIRKASIDELPQLWNVIRGDMSLVGPRPPVPAEVAEYSISDRRRLEVIPGITCIWQVSGRSDIPFDQQVELDSEYIESQSFLGDVRLLLKTIPAVLLGRGAY
ncbi:MAG: multidrug MFS transporter [Planctomycetota bacterium]|nr:MAG: multidrug MFS transporter [Planctomycetota bacterium]